MTTKEFRIHLQIISLKLESIEKTTKEVSSIPEPLFMELENLIRDVRVAKGWK